MGNSSTAEPHALELWLSAPHIELPLGRGGWRCVVFARLSVVGHPANAREVPWDQPVPVNLPHEQAVLLISLYAKVDAEGNEQFLTQVCLPYSGPVSLVDLGIRPGGPPVPLRLALTPGLRIDQGTPEELAEHLRRAREGVRSDRPCLALSVREVQIEPALHDSERPPRSQQDIASSLDTTAGSHQRQKLSTGWLPPDHSSSSVVQLNQRQTPQHVEEQSLCGPVALHERLKHAAPVPPQSNARGFDKTLHTMHQELTNCRERQRKIREKYEERLKCLEDQLHKVPQGLQQMEMSFNPQLHHQQVQHETARVEQHIKEAAARREELMRCRIQAQELTGTSRQPRGAARATESSAEFQRLLTSTTWNDDQLKNLHQQLRALQECMCERTAAEDGVKRSITLLHEEIDDLEHVHRDDCSGKEVRELFIEHETIKERLDGVHAELYQLRSTIDAVREASRQSGKNSNAAELTSLRHENEQKATELQKLRDSEEDRKQTIRELQLEQEALVEKLRLKSALPFVADNGPEQFAQVLERKAQDLTEDLQKAQDACQEREAEVSRLRQMVSDAHASAQALQHAYHELKRSQKADAPGSGRAVSLDFSMEQPADA